MGIHLRVGFRLTVVLMLTASTLGAGTGPGSRVAERHLAFVRAISSQSLRLSTDLLQLANKVEDSGCKLRDYDAAKLTPDQARLGRLYASEFCQPWEKFWDKALAPCEKDDPPDWCDDEVESVRRIDLQGYFATLTSGLEVASSPLERDNIMDIVTSTLHTHVITEFPRDSVDSWVAGAVAPYLKEASPDQALTLATELKDTWVGLGPATMTAFEAYLLGATSLDSEQREAMRHALAKEAKP